MRIWGSRVVCGLFFFGVFMYAYVKHGVYEHEVMVWLEEFG